MRSVIQYCSFLSLAVAWQATSAAEYPTLETAPWRNAGAQRTPQQPGFVPLPQKPKLNAAEVVAPGYTTLRSWREIPEPTWTERQRPSFRPRSLPQTSYPPEPRWSPPGRVIQASAQLPTPAQPEPPRDVQSRANSHVLSPTRPTQIAQQPAVQPEPIVQPEPVVEEPARRYPLPPPPRFETRPLPAPRTEPPPPEPETFHFSPRRNSFLARLTRTPDMFGDFNTVSAAQIGQTSFGDLVVTVPGGGAARRFKNEHARALPTDRVFVFYNHFHNAVAARSQFQSAEDHIDQITLGAEKTFDGGNWSVEVRMPFAASTGVDNGFASAESDGVGNLSVILRKLMYTDQQWAIATGLAVSTPTGSEAEINYAGRQVTIDNEAVHLVPWLAYQLTPDDRWFFHTFLQLDVDANGDSVTVLIPNQGIDDGRFEQQTLLYFDVSAGYWWHRAAESYATGLTGLASVVELHYTTAMEDADATEVGQITVGNLNNRIDVVNLTVGLHSEWNHHTALRIAGVVPLRENQSNRFFDSEIQASLIRRY